MKKIIATLLFVVAGVPDAWAWGSEGHRVVAEIAEQFLEPSTARQVHELLAIENETTLSAVSNWADQIRGQRRNTAAWHYVNIPINASGYDAERDCPRGNCVVAKIDQFSAELRDRGASPGRRLEALKFLVHFVGDVHQPLHASDNGDRGGNEVRLEFNGRQTNLHALWDTGLLAQVVNGDERAYALKLAHSITPGKLKTWETGSAAGWANESHLVAVQVIYAELPHSSGALPASYAAQAVPVVEQQLEKAGVRLAMVLNSVMK